MMIVGALAVLALATAGLFALVDPVLTWYYHLAWWSYIVAVDAVNRRLAGRSLLRDRPRRFLWLALGSVAWWTLFEALNLRLGNWYYVMDPASRALRWIGGVLAFATVLPAIVETVQLAENLGWLRSVRVSRVWGRARRRSCSVGAARSAADGLARWSTTDMGELRLLWSSEQAACRRSSLRDLEQGERGHSDGSILAAACGVLWETELLGAESGLHGAGFEEVKLSRCDVGSAA